MEQLEQLKEMLASARIRLEKNPDFKLVNSLESLIEDLEIAFGPIDEVAVPAKVEAVSEPVEEAVVEETPIEEELLAEEFSNKETTDSFSETIAAAEEIPVSEMLEPTFGDESVVVEETFEAAPATDALSSQLENALDEMAEPVIDGDKVEVLPNEGVAEVADTEEEANPFSTSSFSSTNGSGIPIN